MNIYDDNSVDDRVIWDAISPMLAGWTALVGLDLNLFPALEERPKGFIEIRDELGLSDRAAEAVLNCCVALNLVSLADGVYSLTPASRRFLLKSSPVNLVTWWELTMRNSSLYSFESIRRAIVTDEPQVYDRQDLFDTHRDDAAKAEEFTRAMYSGSAGPASAWPKRVSLADHRRLLDIGGGGGVHAIAAARSSRSLEAVVFDIPPVCSVAREFIGQAGLEERVSTHAGDFWVDPYPSADVHFYSMIFHDWRPEQCAFLAHKSFDSLPRGGRIVVHEMLFNDDKSGPVAVAASSVALLLWTQGKQYSGQEIGTMLSDAGFRDVRTIPTFGYWSVVTGTKP
jgi:hypothetical protein